MNEIRGKIAEETPPRAASLPPPLERAARGRPGFGPFDKAFPVYVSSARGLQNGVGRNISSEGMFVETHEPCGLGQTLRITFMAPELDTEITALAEVRFQCFLNFSSSEGEKEGIRGMGVRFLSFEETEPRGAAPKAQ